MLLPGTVNSVALLDELIARDGAVCAWCGRKPWRSDLTAEHLLPRARGRRGTLENRADHAAYGARQRALLARGAGERRAQR